ncbi:hypothetical protein HDC37_002065 [Microbacterium sp. AK009]|uniref:DUF429 domain-containing protein n=1 Tax=Microbacterium sp. AK009 TaxID=2723068 RepID=UPI0015CE278F|nr:DUF429 domain-containing protein [Microbacterium sp. AK009]NYF17237.1 hypothetical protein [Microbacterium sp. AK009]
MQTVGVDLAASPQGTAMAVIDWSDEVAEVTALVVGIDDQDIVAAARGASSVGIDCALGWPVDFVDFVWQHARGAPPSGPDSGLEWRRRLAYRHTDRIVRERTGRWPLSVATDRLGLTAMRCAELTARFAAAGVRVDRSGAGVLVEVYPAAALRLWGIAVPAYKVDAAARGEAVAGLTDAAPWLHIPAAVESHMLRSADAFDAVVAGLNARAHAIGATTPVPPGAAHLARREGWIALPETSLAELMNARRIPADRDGRYGMLEGFPAEEDAVPDPRREPTRVGPLQLAPADAPERWRLTMTREETEQCEATWGEWVRLAQRVLRLDALSRDLEERGDAWDRGFAAGQATASDEGAESGSANPYR